MAKEMELQIVRCPNCKKPMTSFNAFKTVVTCSRCGTAFKNPEITAKPAVLPERILPFTSQEGDFEQSMINTLVNQEYCDKNIFAAINTDNVFRAYLPMYLYEGQFTAAWGCESSYEDQKVDISNNWGGGKDISTKTVKKWRPQNGNSAGRFAFLCLANESQDDLPPELREFTTQYPYDVMLSKQFDPTYLESGDETILTIERNADNALVWQKHGKDLVDEKARQAALELLAGQEIRNFKAQTSWSLETKGEYLLVPFWFVYYTVNNQRYYYLMDGTGTHHAYSYPVDEEDVAFTKSRERIISLVGWAWVLVFLLLWITGWDFTVGIVYLIIWWIAKFIVKKVMNKQIDANLEASHQKRQEGAARL